MNSILSWISEHEQMIYIVILMVFVGIEVIGRVPSVLHTPLMSGANAIHGFIHQGDLPGSSSRFIVTADGKPLLSAGDEDPTVVKL